MTASAVGTYLSDRPLNADLPPRVHSFCPLLGVQANRPPRTARLAATTLELTLADGGRLRHRFDDEVVAWAGADGAPSEGRAGYEAFELREDIILVDLTVGGDPRESALWVIDLARERALGVRTSIVAGDQDGHAALTSVHPAGIGRELAEAFPESDGLAGRRVQYHYGGENIFEHIYLTPRLFTWHGLTGLEAGAADTEPARTYAIDEELFLFRWTERVKPHDGAVVVDLRALRSTGRLVGFDAATGSMMHVTVGANATMLNYTEHEIRYDRV